MKDTNLWRRLEVRAPVYSISVLIHPSWLVILPVGLWAITALYVPILDSSLSPVETWGVALSILLFSAVSLLGHLLAHLFINRAAGGELPATLSVLLFGDTAQAWQAGRTAWREAWAALAGPVFNLLFAGLAYLTWNAQINSLVNLSALFICAYNGWLAVINLIPAFPFDGGRLARAILWGLAKDPLAGNRLGTRLGTWMPLALTAWGITLILQRQRFSWVTGVVTIAFGMIILVGLRAQPAWQWNRPVQAGRGLRRWFGMMAAGLLLLGLTGIAASLLLLNDGLEAPGLALSVEPMVEAPTTYQYLHTGTFILTTVIPQAPITAGEWLVGQLSPAVKIVPAETIVPENTTPQEIARQGFQMLDESEAAAIVVGLRQAGYEANMVGKGVEVISIQPDSPAGSRLQPGDVITGMNGKPVRITVDLINLIHAQDQHATVRLQVEREGDTLNLAVPLMPPDIPGDAPKLGITIDSAGFDLSLPFPVKITPKKIAGGPSAGLMFALTVYNTVTPGDLTGGRKIAGTGKINLDGSVGPIGGVEQKVAAAESASASYFLSPPENYAAAVSAARHIRVIKVRTIEEAIGFLRGLTPQ